MRQAPSFPPALLVVAIAVALSAALLPATAAMPPGEGETVGVESVMAYPTPAPPALSQLPEHSEHIANYRIDVRLLTEEKELVGTQTMSWTNTSSDQIEELWFHLYWNAAKNDQSTFMKEMTGSGGGGRGAGIEEWGWIDVERIELADGTDLMPTFEYMQPDDDNADDQTVFRVRLPEPLGPGEQAVLEMDWTSRIPKGFARTGYYNDFFFIVQWFPKIGVYENGAWNCHQYHAPTEYYADFGVYEVTITAPQEYQIGATGKRMSERDNGDGTFTVTHYQEDVHDFAWLADRDVIVVEDRFEEPGLHPVDIKLFLQPEHAHYGDRYLTATRHALHYFGTWYGSYPYDVLTVVDPQPGSTAGGMEYPTLFTGGAAYWNPEWVLSPEGVTIHEFGHQFWYGLVANNEFEHAWLDEGFNSYSETKIGEIAYGPALPAYQVAGLNFQRFVPVNLSAIPVIPLPPWRGRGTDAVAFFRDLALITFPGGVGQGAADQHRRGYLEGPTADQMERDGWDFFTRSSYGLNSYPRPAAFLEMLESYFGEELWGRVMRTYHERWRFRHPTGRDFLAVVNEVTGEDMTELFEQVVWGSGLFDYGVDYLITDTTPEEVYVSQVAVRRYGDVVFPVELLVTFEDGSTQTEQWDGKYRWKKFQYERPVPVSRAEIYPGRPLWLDANLTNDGAIAEPTDVAAKRLTMTYLFWLQNVLHWFSLFA